MNDTTDPKDYQKLEEFLEQCKFRISGMTDATKLTAKEMRELMNNSQLVAKVLGNINTSSLKDLTTARDAIQKSMNNADPSSWKYKSQEENLKKVQNRIAQIKAEQQQINSLVDQYDIELRNCQKSSAEINKESQMIGQTMNNLTKSSIRELEMAKDLVEQRLKYTRQDSEEFKTLTHQAKQLNNQLEIVNNKSKTPAASGRKSPGSSIPIGVSLHKLLVPLPALPSPSVRLLQLMLRWRTQWPMFANIQIRQMNRCG